MNPGAGGQSSDRLPDDDVASAGHGSMIEGRITARSVRRGNDP
jgi:hypothetical protein